MILTRMTQITAIALFAALSLSTANAYSIEAPQAATVALDPEVSNLLDVLQHCRVEFATLARTPAQMVVERLESDEKTSVERVFRIKYLDMPQQGFGGEVRLIATLTMKRKEVLENAFYADRPTTFAYSCSVNY